MNTFGSSQLRFALVDSVGTIAERARFRRQAIPLLSRVNQFYCPAGRQPFRGWVLLPRYEYVQLSAYATDLRLQIGDPTRSDNVGELRGLRIVQARCVTRGLESDRNSLYLVELTDARGVLHNRWFQAPITAAYNVRAPAYPQVFQPQSMNGGTTWTWATMLQDMWTGINALTSTALGTWPGLPQGVVLAGTPEGFWFPGAPAWYALNDVLHHLGMKVACDLTSANPYTIVMMSASDSAFSSLTTRYNNQDRLQEDLEWLDAGAGRVPKTVYVLFRRRNSVFGTEETARHNSPQWNMSAYYSVPVSAPSAYNSSTGVHHLWSDFTVRYDMDGVILTADAVDAATIAAERASRYYDWVTQSYLTRTYAGALPFKTGSQVDGICWYMDSRARYGWTTQVVRGTPLWPELWEV